MGPNWGQEESEWEPLKILYENKVYVSIVTCNTPLFLIAKVILDGPDIKKFTVNFSGKLLLY